ncbi:MAG: methionine--tRNA ligase subunit beta [Candidatus Niyogibacteria bacterium]|nr:methionine--tRNA ligase subunit beta [Candidatus Niyogibacteria bacterium]
MINYDDFKKVELKIGRVLAAERVEGSEKLLKLQVDDGTKAENGEAAPRQVIAGIGKKYAPEELVGQEIAFVANLEPRKLMGLESNGMILAAHDAEGLPVILNPGEEVPSGSKIS